MAKSIYVVEAMDNGVTKAFEKLEDAQKFCWDIYMSELDDIHSHTFTPDQVVATFKEDYHTLYNENYIVDYLWIYEVPLIFGGEIDD